MPNNIVCVLEVKRCRGYAADFTSESIAKRIWRWARASGQL